MMLENIVRHYEMGKNRRQAALDGSNEITFAAIATTIAIAAIFIPVVFMQGVVGRFFYQYGITVTVAVFLSLLEALTLTPMRCARFLHSAKLHSPGWILATMDAFMEWLAAPLSGRPRTGRSTTAASWSCCLAGDLRRVDALSQGASQGADSGAGPVAVSADDQDAGRHLDPGDRSRLHEGRGLSQGSSPRSQDYYTTIGNYKNNNVVNAGTIYVILKDAKRPQAHQREVMDRSTRGPPEAAPGRRRSSRRTCRSPASAPRAVIRSSSRSKGPDWNKLMGLSKDDHRQARGHRAWSRTSTPITRTACRRSRSIPDRDKAADARRERHDDRSGGRQPDRRRSSSTPTPSIR